MDTVDKAPKARFSRKKLVILALGVCSVLFLCVIALFITGTAYAYKSDKEVPVFTSLVEKYEFAVWNNDKSKFLDESVPSFSSINDGEVTQQDIVNLLLGEEETSYAYKGSLSVDGKITEEGANFDGSFTINMEGDIDGSTDRPKADLKIDGTYKAEGTTFEGNGNMRIIGETLYIKVDTFPTLGVFDASSVKGEWIEVDLKDYYESLESDSSNETIEDQRKAIEALIQDGIIQNNVNYLGYGNASETGGVVTRCFDADFDHSEITRMLEIVNAQMSEENKMSENDIENHVIEKMYVYFCLGKNDSLVYQMNVDVQVKDENNEVNIQYKSTMKDFGKEMNVERPDNAKTFEEIMNELYPPVEDSYYYDDTYQNDYYKDDGIGI